MDQTQSLHSRRRFLKMGGLLIAGSSVLRPGRIQATCRSGIKNIGVQLYSVRKEMLADATGTLKELAKIGFKQLESARSDKVNYYGLAPKEIKSICDDLGMKLISGHVHADEDFEKSIEQATETGQEYLIASVLPSKGQTIANYQASADAFNKLGTACKKAGLSFGYHNHEYEFDKVDGKILYDVLLERSDPAMVTMEMDLGWAVAAGQDPLQYFKRHPGRFHLWHLKDMDLVKKHSVEFGKGQVNIKQLLQHAKQSGMKHFFLEQEEYARTAFESMQEDFTYLAHLHY